MSNLGDKSAQDIDIRTHAAIEAMKGLLSNSEFYRAMAMLKKDSKIKDHFDHVAIISELHADALLKELEK